MKISIPITIIKVEGGGCHLLVKSRLNAEVSGHLIIDTGASSSAFDLDQCKPYSEDIYLVSDIQSSGVTSESLNAKPVRMKKIWIGRYRFQVSQAVLIDLNHIKQLYLQFSKKNIIGLLGGNFLKEHRAIIDYKNRLLHLQIKK
jgi:hypothetical protein